MSGSGSNLTTLTTTGYGDIAPVDPFARSLANLESVLGQFFLAITVARLATLELQGIEAVVGSSNFYERVTDGVHAWQQAKERRAAVKEPVRAAAFDR